MYWINLIGTTIVSMIASYIFACNVTNTNLKCIFTKKKIIIYLFLNLLFFLNLMFMKDLNKVLLNIFIIFYMSSFIIFNYDYRKSIFYTLILFFTSCIIEVVGMVFISFLFKFSLNSYSNLELGMLLFSIVNSMFLVIISYLKHIRIILNKLYMMMNNKIKSYLILIFITGYVILLCYNNFKILKNDTNSLINLGMLIFILISSIILVYNSINKSKIEDKYNQMVEYVSKYEKIINEQGKRNHEFNNQLMVLNGYIDNKKKLKEYLSLIINEQKGGQNFRIKQLGYLPDGGLKGLIYYKLSKMEEKGIKSFLYVSNDLKDCFNDIDTEFYSDITKIFGVFIDNAIDAASESKKKEIEIDIRKEENTLVVMISNTFKDNGDLSKVGKKGYTSKGIGHGFGLSIVKDITKKNDKIESFSDIEKDMFKQTLIIYLK